MFVYLSKKLAIGNGIRVTAISWSTDQGWIAVGADDGGVRMIRVEAANYAHKGLAVNQQITAHTKSITGCNWNDMHQKLTTSDCSGLIIVWSCKNKEDWAEEMVNNRGKTHSVTGLDWSPDGTMIAILYEDGLMIIGSVEGTRLWQKDHKAICRNVHWSPDSKILLVGVGNEIQAYDDTGEQFYLSL